MSSKHNLKMEDSKHVNELWNIKNLKPPPTLTHKTMILRQDSTTLRNTLLDAINIFQNQIQFEREAAFLSRFIYCMKTKLRQCKVIKIMSKINQAILRYLRINIICRLQTFLETVPQSYSDTMYLPTKSMLQYILVRIQSIGKLMVRIIETTKIAALTIEQLLSVGHLWKIYFIAYGITSRLYALSRNITKCYCKLYADLIPFQEILQNTNLEWLPHDYTLPKDLKLWLNVDCLDDNTSAQIVTVNKPLLSMLNYAEIESDDDLNEIDTFKIAESSYNINEMNIEVCEPQHKEDLGIPITKLANNNSKKHVKKKKKPKSVQSHKIDTSIQIQTLDDLRKFEREFKKYPAKYSDNFKKLDKIQCNMLHKTILKYVKKSEININDTLKVKTYLVKARSALHCLQSN